MKRMGFRKTLVFFRSMKFGIALLILIMFISMIGTIIPQGMDEHFYSSSFTPVILKFILFLGLNDIYNSILFEAFFIALTVNLFMCSIFRLGNVIKRMKTNPSIDSMNFEATEKIDFNESINSTIGETFRKNGFHSYSQDKLNADIYYSMKNRAGYFGSWMLHFGILLVIVYYAYGHTTFFSESVYGISETIQEIEGTEYKVRINDFNIDYSEDGSVLQYTSNIELLDNSGKLLKASHVAVNEPMRFQGYTFYQTAYGWAAKCNVSKSGDIVIQDVIYEKTSLNIPKENIGIYFNSFYPDFAASSQGFMTLSDNLKNPVILYSLIYMGEIVKKDIVPIGEIIKWNQYEFLIHSPQRYTYLDVNKMNGQLGAALGALLVIIGLILAFYFKPIKMIIQVEATKLNVYRYAPLCKETKERNLKEKDSFVK